MKLLFVGILMILSFSMAMIFQTTLGKYIMSVDVGVIELYVVEKEETNPDEDENDLYKEDDSTKTASLTLKYDSKL